MQTRLLSKEGTICVQNMQHELNYDLQFASNTSTSLGRHLLLFYRWQSYRNVTQFLKLFGKLKLRGLSLRANYIDRATAASRSS
jgi:hypothetical protein